jgi:hypothetical protein
MMRRAAICLSLVLSFQRSVHATAVSYATVIAITVVTAIIFFVRLQIYSSTHSRSNAVADTWYTIPLNIRRPDVLEPVFLSDYIFCTAAAAIPSLDYLGRRFYRSRRPGCSSDPAQFAAQC